MKKLNSIFIVSSFISLLLSPWNASAQTLSIVHTTAGALEEETAQALGDTDPASIIQLSISGETLDNTDATYLRSTFGATLESLDVTGIAFTDNRLTDKLCQGMTALKNISVPSELTAIGKNALANCSGLELISNWEQVVNIDDYAFQNCSKLGIKALPENLTRIGQSGFSKCSAITITELPAQLSGIGMRAFEFCSGVTIQHLPEAITEIKERAFDRTGITHLTLSENIVNIGNLAFYTTGNPQRRFICRGENMPQLGDRSFGDVADISNTTMQVLKKYADNHTGWASAGMTLEYLTHHISFSIQGEGLVEVSGDGIISNEVPIENGTTLEGYEEGTFTLTVNKEATVKLNGETILPDPGTSGAYTIAIGTDDIAVDIEFSISTGIEATTNQPVSCLVKGHMLYLTGEVSTPIMIFNFTGKLVLSTSSSNIDLSPLAPGIYFIKSSNHTFKIIRP